MRVEVRLYATFAKFGPTQRAGDLFYVEVGASASLASLITKLGIPEEEVHLVIINGRPVHDRSLRLSEANRIGLFPPVGGG